MMITCQAFSVLMRYQGIGKPKPCQHKIFTLQHTKAHRILGPISQRDLSRDLDLNLRLWS